MNYVCEYSCMFVQSTTMLPDVLKIQIRGFLFYDNLRAL
jgi:hypothetical protein